MTETARLCEQNMRAWHLARVEAAGGVVRSKGELAWGIAPGELFPSGSDRIVPFPGKPEAADLDAMISDFDRAEKEPWCTFGSPEKTRSTRLAFKQSGFGFTFAGLSMERRAEDMPDESVPEGVQIERLTGSEVTTCVGDTDIHPSYGDMSRHSARNSLASVGSLASTDDAALAVLAARGGDQIVGWLTVYRNADSRGIYDLGVLESHRRLGIGGALLRAALKGRAGSNDLPFVLQNDASLEAFYNRFGFRRVGTIEHWVRSADAVRSAATDLSMEELAVAIGTRDTKAIADIVDDQPALLGERLASNGATPLHLAAYHGLESAVGMMLDRGADADERDSLFSSTPLDWAVHALSPSGPVFKKGQAEAARLIARAGGKSARNTTDDVLSDLARFDD